MGLRDRAAHPLNRESGGADEVGLHDGEQIGHLASPLLSPRGRLAPASARPKQPRRHHRTTQTNPGRRDEPIKVDRRHPDGSCCARIGDARRPYLPAPRQPRYAPRRATPRRRSCVGAGRTAADIHNAGKADDAVDLTGNHQRINIDRAEIIDDYPRRSSSLMRERNTVTAPPSYLAPASAQPRTITGTAATFLTPGLPLLLARECSATHASHTTTRSRPSNIGEIRQYSSWNTASGAPSPSPAHNGL